MGNHIMSLRLAVGIALCPLPAGAQAAPSVLPDVDTGPLGNSRYAVMETVLEKTIFKVDVLRLEVRVDTATARRLESLVRSAHRSQEVEDPIALAVLAAPHAIARVTFERNISLKQFLDAVEDGMQKTADAGWLSEEEFLDINGWMPRWFGFLAEDGIRDGDVITYRLSGDTLRKVYRTVAGEIPLDEILVGRKHRYGVLGAYFAPKSSFRKKLLRSLFRTLDSASWASCAGSSRSTHRIIRGRAGTRKRTLARSPAVPLCGSADP